MVFPLILISIGILLFLIISYNITQQYKQKQETAKKITVAKQKAIIDETEEILLNSSRIPFSKSLIMMLHQRIMNALHTIKQVDNNFPGLKERLTNVKAQVQQIDENYESLPQVAFRSPDTDNEAIQMLKVVKKIRAVVRSEHSKGRINTSVYVQEDRRLELIQLKINVENAIKRAYESQAHRQYGTARQILTKAISAIASVSDRDEHLEHRLSEMKQMNLDMDEKLRSAGEEQTRIQAEKEADDLDVLFAPKKKW